MGKNVDEPQSSQDLAKIARELYGNTDPLRQNLIGRSMSFLGMDPSAISTQETVTRQLPQPANPYAPGSNDYRDFNPGMPETITETIDRPLLNPDYLPSGPTGVEASPLFAALKQTTEDQYSRARDNILGSIPQGGALTDSLVNLETSRARDMTTNIGNLYQQELDRAMSFALGTPVQSMQGLGQAANVQSNMALANAQNNAATKQALGAGAGAYFGSKNPAKPGV